MKRKKKKKNKGSYLKEIAISCLLKKKTCIKEAKDFIFKLIPLMKVELVSLTVNDMPPGFDILCVIKESHIVFSYW